jgi:hypothetical protein
MFCGASSRPSQKPEIDQASRAGLSEAFYKEKTFTLYSVLVTRFKGIFRDAWSLSAQIINKRFGKLDPPWLPLAKVQSFGIASRHGFSVKK